MLEERVVGDGYFVEVDVGLATGEAEGLRVGDEVDLVGRVRRARCRARWLLLRSRRRWIAGDADLHKIFRSLDALMRPSEALFG